MKYTPKSVKGRGGGGPSPKQGEWGKGGDRGGRGGGRGGRGGGIMKSKQSWNNKNKDGNSNGNRGGRKGPGGGRGRNNNNKRNNDVNGYFQAQINQKFKEEEGSGDEEEREDDGRNPFLQLRKKNKKNDGGELEIATGLGGDSFGKVKDEEDTDDENGGYGGGGGSKSQFTKDNKKLGKKKTGGFQSMGLSPLVLKGILRRGYQVPTPIQRKTIPLILEGRDVVAMARTGSGKTAAFLIPLFEKLQVNRTEIGSTTKYPRAIIISPTRELANQTVKFFREIGKFLGLKVASILGGDSMETQFQMLHDKPDVVIATPGRLMHLCVEMELKLDGVQYIVFDEADRLFEMGFGEQISEIVRRLPDSRQTVLFSATLPKLLAEFTKAGLHNPELLRLDVDTKLPETLKLTYLACRSEDKMAALMRLLKELVYEKGQILVFVSTKHHVELIHQLLDEQQISNCYIYSSLDPSARKIEIAKFRSGKCNVMIVTDIAARGIDIPILDNVINFHFPAKPKLFMHRVGRVARAGKTGTAYSIIAPDEIAYLLDLHLFLNKPLKFDTHTKVTSSDEDDSCVVGRVPQDLLNEENAVVAKLLDFKAELETLTKVCRNGYNQYLKSRPSASTESNRRAKEVEVNTLAVHPMFTEHVQDDPMDNLISQMHSYRPNSTIFEIGPKASTETQKIMKFKRERDQNVVEKHRMAKATLDLAKSSKPVKDEENYIPYLPKDHVTESALSVGTTFDRQIQESAMDITGDDSDLLRTQRSITKWDQKKKNFVAAGKDIKAKKIKTESGAWIAASYKSDRYKNWKEKSKVDQQMEQDSGNESDDDFTNKGSNPEFRRPAFSRRLVKTGKNEAPGGIKQKGMKFNSELKRPEEILKDRKEKEKKKLKNMSKGDKKKGKGKGKKSGSKKPGQQSFRKKK